MASSAPASLVDLPSGRGEPLAEATFEPAAFAPPPPPPRRALSSCSCMRSGPEKKLEVYFSRGDDNSGLRRFQHDVWSDMLADAACTIIHQESNKDFDAYLLSESSMFVYPDRLILKTCGTTTLLLALPKVRAPATCCSPCVRLRRSPGV